MSNCIPLQKLEGFQGKKETIFLQLYYITLFVAPAVEINIIRISDLVMTFANKNRWCIILHIRFISTNWCTKFEGMYLLLYIWYKTLIIQKGVYPYQWLAYFVLKNQTSFDCLYYLYFQPCTTGRWTICHLAGLLHKCIYCKYILFHFESYNYNHTFIEINKQIYKLCQCHQQIWRENVSHKKLRCVWLMLAPYITWISFIPKNFLCILQVFSFLLVVSIQSFLPFYNIQY